MTFDLHVGNVLDVLPTLPEKSVHTCVTSPPYFGLRQYLPDGVQLRSDLTDKEKAAVIAELEALGVYPT